MLYLWEICIFEIISYCCYTNNLNHNFFLRSLVFGVCAITSSFIFQLWIIMIDADLSTNISRAYRFLFTMEYFIDQEKYFYLTLLHINAAVCIGSAIMISNGAIFIAFIQHTCGMLKIARYEHRSDLII